MSEIDQAREIREHLEAPLGSWSAYDYDDVPATLPPIYAQVTVSRRFGGEPRGCGRRPIVGWRLTTLAVGRTVDEARQARDWIHAALNEQRIASLGTSLIELESETAIQSDDGRYSGVTNWTYSTNA